MEKLAWSTKLYKVLKLWIVENLQVRIGLHMARCGSMTKNVENGYIMDGSMVKGIILKISVDRIPQNKEFNSW